MRSKDATQRTERCIASVSGCFLSFLILISSCMPSGQPAGTRDGSRRIESNLPVLSPAGSVPVPRLMGVNHLFNIAGHFSQPVGIATDVEGNLYVADSGKSVIHVLDRDGRLSESIGRFGWRTGELDRPTGIAMDSQQFRLYIADGGNNRIQRFSLINRSFRTIVGEKYDETETPVSLRGPQGVAVDKRGYVYIADTWNHRILKIDPLGRLQMEIGGIAGWAGQQFRNPQGVAVDAKSNIYISDTGNHRVHKLDFSGSQIAIWGEEGTAQGQFQNPAGQAIDRFGNVYVADRGNHRVQVFSPEGLYLTEFGQQVLVDPVDLTMVFLALGDSKVDNSLRAYVTDAAAGDIEVFRVIYEMAGKR